MQFYVGFSLLHVFTHPLQNNSICVTLWKITKGGKYHGQTISHRGGVKSSYSKCFGNFNSRGFVNFCCTFFNKTLAFTLAETLIVMGIIGVVAALTLPNLNSSTGDKEKVAKVKKIYSNLNDALGRAVAVYGPISEWTQNDTSSDAKSKRVADRLTEFMKISKDCG